MRVTVMFMKKIITEREVIENADYSVILSNIDNVPLKIGMQLLRASMNIDVYTDILELMPLIQDNIAATISVTNILVEYLEIAEDVLLPIRVEGIVLQNVLRWLHSEHIDIRLNATKILLALSRRPENYSIVNHQLIELVNTDSVRIKTLIMYRLKNVQGLTDTTKDYIISKCREDANFAVRMVCMKEEQMGEL